MQLIFSTLLSLCSGAEKLRSVFWYTKWNKRCVGTGDVLLVYQMDKKMPLVQETCFWCTNEDKTSVSGQWKETVAEQ